MPKDLPILRLADVIAWRNWLSREGPSSEGVMLATIKKNATDTSTTLRYNQALDEALCHGWIDSGGRKLDDDIYLFRFCPRKKDSLWSKRNVGYAERLEKENRIQPAGRLTIEEAKANGRWDSAYSGSGSTEMPPDFIAALEKVPKAKAAWEDLGKGARWRIYFRLNNLKTAKGREKRIKCDVEMLASGEVSAPQKSAVRRKKGEVEGVSSHTSATESESKHVEQETPSRRSRRGRCIPSYAE